MAIGWLDRFVAVENLFGAIARRAVAVDALAVGRLNGLIAVDNLFGAIARRTAPVCIGQVGLVEHRELLTLLCSGHIARLHDGKIGLSRIVTCIADTRQHGHIRRAIAVTDTPTGDVGNIVSQTIAIGPHACWRWCNAGVAVAIATDGPDQRRIRSVYRRTGRWHTRTRCRCFQIGVEVEIATTTLIGPGCGGNRARDLRVLRRLVDEGGDRADGRRSFGIEIAATVHRTGQRGITANRDVDPADAAINPARRADSLVVLCRPAVVDIEPGLTGGVARALRDVHALGGAAAAGFADGCNTDISVV